ncbi:MAG: hypothetical protein ACSLEX_04155 [Minisyncoccota bacterium]
MAGTTYVPGMCNIGKEEIKKRNRTGQVGLIALIVLWVFFIWFDIAPIWRLTLFVPALAMSMGFLQAYMHFCVYFGLAHLFNFGTIGMLDSVEQAEFRAKDRHRAWSLIVLGGFISTSVALAGYWL